MEISPRYESKLIYYLNKYDNILCDNKSIRAFKSIFTRTFKEFENDLNDQRYSFLLSLFDKFVFFSKAEVSKIKTQDQLDQFIASAENVMTYWQDAFGEFNISIKGKTHLEKTFNWYVRLMKHCLALLSVLQQQKFIYQTEDGKAMLQGIMLCCSVLYSQKQLKQYLNDNQWMPFDKFFQRFFQIYFNIRETNILRTKRDFELLYKDFEKEFNLFNKRFPTIIKKYLKKDDENGLFFL